MLKAVNHLIILIFLFHCWLPEVSGQPSIGFDLKKPEKFENKILGSEKTGDKKFNFPRRVIQNTVTHYNWHFNAETRLNEIINRAKSLHLDDYSQLLPFYNYSIESTVRDSAELDSVLYKANAGILIHDLRNAWIDNLYMLMGKAYFLKNELDSAYLTFQYINYAFAPKEEDGYDKPIGSNATEGGNAFSISTKENNTLLRKVVSTPPSRNESFIWQIKTYIENGDFAEAAGLIETLRTDPAFPERLDTDLNEVRALWFYKRQMYDSAAFYLEHSLANAANKNEQSRWEYLIAQLYEKAGKSEQAQAFYQKAIRHTVNPVLEVYARLNSIRQNKGDSNAIKINIQDLVKMGKKDRYSRYRDIIYFTAAQIELERNNIPGAKFYLLKSAQYADLNMAGNQRARSFILLGDLSYAAREYREAKSFYDSIVAGDPVIVDAVAFDKRNEILATIVEETAVLQRHDSLQRLAAMPEDEREVFIRKKLREFRKAQGLQELETTVPLTGTVNNDIAAADLFGTATKGEWYFYNPGLKSKGFTAFKGKWGNRPNVDNWRRIDAVNAFNNVSGRDPLIASGKLVENVPMELSYEAMLKNIPITSELMALSNDSIENSTVNLGKIYLEGLEDYSTVISTLDPFPSKFEYSNRLPEALYYLYYSYKKSGDEQKANEIMRFLQDKFPGTPFERMISNAVNGNEPQDAKTQMTILYDQIYNLFIEGKFEEALAEKKNADRLYGTNYWTPQLLYIESIYHIRQRNDDEAKSALKQLITLYPDSPMKDKATTLLDVLNRRKEIEEYLTNLKIERPTEDSIVIIDDKPVTPPVVVVKDAAPATIIVPETPRLTQPVIASKDSVQLSKPVPLSRSFTFTPDAAHYVVIVTENVDPVYVTETRNAFNRFNKEKYYNKVIEINNQVLSDTSKLVVMSGFLNAAEALEYVEKTSKIASTKIIPWLPVGKYSFIIISEQNLEVLKTIQSMPEYRKFLAQHFPGKL